MGREGFRHVTVLSAPEEIDAATIERQRLWTDLRDEHREENAAARWK